MFKRTSSCISSLLRGSVRYSAAEVCKSEEESSDMKSFVSDKLELVDIS